MAERARQVGLSRSGGSADEHGQAVADPLPRSEAQDERAVQSAGGLEVDVFDGRVEMELGVAFQALVDRRCFRAVFSRSMPRERRVLDGQFGDVKDMATWTSMSSAMPASRSS